MLRSLKNERGFTLIELVIIIILIGVLAAIAIPRYVDLRDNAVRASAQATLDAGRAAINLDFADKILNTGSYTFEPTDATAVGSVFDPTDVTDLENELQSGPNYPPNGAYNSPAGQGFRWWLVTQGSGTPAQPPVIDAIIDLTCDAADAVSGANNDCFVSKL
ncbi:MAG: prepilin-type N-terminal cleavage/methylation domain-containing protein [Candidatus Methylomirabilales bacterium]